MTRDPEIRPVRPIGGDPPTPERLLTPEEAAALLGVSVRWIYRHAAKFTFTRKLSRKVLRFHEPGLRRYMENGRR